MRLEYILERGSESDIRSFEDSLKKAKRGIKEICEIWSDMKEQFSERGGRMSRRSSDKHDDDWD